MFNNTSRYKIKNNILYCDKKQIGILKPTIFYERVTDGIEIYASKGVVLLKDTLKEDEKLMRLVAVGAILFGNTDEIKEVNNLLNSPIYSRTYSYITECVDDLKQILEIKNNICKTKILIVGSGGIGAMTALNLAGIGFTNLTIVEGDTIEQSNLNRQFLFSIKDIGKFKVVVTKNFIQERFPKCKINAIVEFVKPDKLEKHIKKNDITIMTADEPEGIEFHAYKIAERLQKIIIGGGYSMNTSKVFSNIGSKISEEELSQNVKRFPFSIMPSFGPTNTEISGILSSLTLQFVTKKLKNNKKIEMIWDNTNFPRKIEKI